MATNKEFHFDSKKTSSISLKSFTTLLTAALFLIACSPDPEGDGGAGGSVSGLEMATTMSVVTPVSGDPTVSPALSSFLNTPIVKQIISNASFPADSDYMQDNTNTSVWNDSLESLGAVNFILCLLGQAGVSDMVNEGAYVALLEVTTCLEQAGFGDSDNDQFWRVVVTSSRAFEHSPQYVRIWLPVQDNDPQADPDITGGGLLDAVIYAAPSAEHPNGLFSLSFSMVINDPNDTDYGLPNNLGTIKTSNTGSFIYAFELGDPLVQTDDYFIQTANAILDDSAGSTGAAKTFEREIRDDTADPMTPDLAISQSSNEIVFDVDFFYRKKVALGSPDDEECFDRSDPYFSVWDYRLYHENAGLFKGRTVTAGQRLKLTTDLYFDYTFGGVQYYGSLRDDYFWWNGSGLFPDQSIIQVTDWETNVTSDYVIHISEGKFDRRTGESLLVSSLAGLKMEYSGPYSGTPGGIGGGITWDTTGRYPGNFGFDRWEVEVLAGNNFVITGGKTYNPATYQYDITPVTQANVNEPVNNDAINAPGVVSGQPLQVWAPSVGSLTYKEVGDPDVDRNVSYVVYGTAPPYEAGLNGTVLYCYKDCPIGGVSMPQDTAPGANYWKYPNFDTAVTGAGTTLLDTNFNFAVNEGGARTYTIQVNATGTKYQLIDDTATAAAGFDVFVTVTDSTNLSGSSVRSDYMILTPLTDVRHPGVNPGGANSIYDVHNLSSGQSSFAWTSGTDESNLAHTATEGTAVGPVVRFDAPLKFLHQHTTLTEDRNGARGDPIVDSYNGQTLNLTYNNYLSGIPNHNLANMDVERWVSSVNFVNGVQMIDTDGNQFVIKARRQSEMMLPIVLPDGMGGFISDITSCTAMPNFSVIDTLTTPGREELNPITFDFSDIPMSASGPPAVIQGEVQ